MKTRAHLLVPIYKLAFLLIFLLLPALGVQAQRAAAPASSGPPSPPPCTNCVTTSIAGSNGAVPVFTGTSTIAPSHVADDGSSVQIGGQVTVELATGNVALGSKVTIDSANGVVSADGDGAGLMGVDRGLIGGTVGVLGQAFGDNGAAVLGVESGCNQSISDSTPCGLTGNSGITAGVRGISLSPRGFGVRGFASAATGPTLGVEGQSQSNAGTGMFGAANSLTGSTVGVRGLTRSNDGIGVLAQSFDTSATPGHLAMAMMAQSFSLPSNAGVFFKGFGGPPTTFASLQASNTFDLGEAAWFLQSNPLNPSPVMKLLIDPSSTHDFLQCVAGSPEVQRCHVSSAGTFVSGSDFAEALPARGPRDEFGPGDVLTMASDGYGVEKSVEPYSKRAVGVFSTRPAVLGADKGGITRVDAQDLPVAITGIVPTKVSAENGPIEVGDLLVTSSTPGMAMKGSDASRLMGTVIGKALQALPSGNGVIPVLIMLR